MAKPDKQAKPAETTVHAPSAPHAATAVATTGATSVQAPATPVATAVTVSGPSAIPGFVSKRQVVLPVLNLKVGEPRLILFRSPMRVSDYVDPDPKKQNEKPATIAEAGDPSTGEQFLLLVPAVMEENLKKTYPDDSYVGRVFFAEKLPKRVGKRYHDFHIEEGEYQVPALEGDGA